MITKRHGVRLRYIVDLGWLVEAPVGLLPSQVASVIAHAMPLQRMRLDAKLADARVSVEEKAKARQIVDDLAAGKVTVRIVGYQGDSKGDIDLFKATKAPGTDRPSFIPKGI